MVHKFRKLYETDPEKATDYYYDLSRSSNYIRVDRVAKDEKWTGMTPYGEIIITINLSKPEKDPKAIAAAPPAEEQQLSKMRAVPGKRRVYRFGFSGGPGQPPVDSRDAAGRRLVLAVFPLCVL